MGFWSLFDTLPSGVSGIPHLQSQIARQNKHYDWPVFEGCRSFTYDRGSEIENCAKIIDFIDLYEICFSSLLLRLLTLAGKRLFRPIVSLAGRHQVITIFLPAPVRIQQSVVDSNIFSDTQKFGSSLIRLIHLYNILFEIIYSSLLIRGKA